MTLQHQAREQVIAAGLRLKVAADHWNATDLTAIEGCVSSLEQSAAELNQTLETLRDMPRESRADLAAQLLLIKDDAGRLGRLSDASASFLRCAPGAGSGESDFYGADATHYSIPGAEPRGTEA